MLRITPSHAHDRSHLKFEGRLLGQWVPIARATCDDARLAGGALTVDLSAVTFVDDEGLALLADLRARGVELLHCTPYVRALLALEVL